MDIIYHQSQIKKIAAQLWQLGSQKKVWAFYACIGSGKTTLIHAVCDELKVKQSVSSPTFAIINEYTSLIAGTIYHMDWYRIKDEAEAIEAGCADCIESGNYCFIEWPEKAAKLLPENTFTITLEMITAFERKLTTNNSF